jgi:hypothetical protein
MTQPYRTKTELTIKGDLRALRLKPGDILTCSVDQALSQDQSDHIAKSLRRLLDAAGLGNEVIVTPKGVRLGV